MCPTLEKYGLLTEFPQNVYKVYFHQRRNQMLIELAKLIKVPNLNKILEKSVNGLKWKMIEEVFERRKNDSRFFKEKGRILALEIFGIVLFPNFTWIVSLEVAITFVAYENTH